MKRCLNVLPAYLKAVITAGALTMASALVIAPASAQVNCAPGMQGPVAFNPPPPAVGTFANPWINQRHVLCGEINRWGNAVGWHYRQGGNDPVFAGGPDIQLQAKINGAINQNAGAPGWNIYTGNNIDIRDQRDGVFVPKNNISTFYPDNCTAAEVIQSIRYAYTNLAVPIPPAGGQFNGPSGPIPADGLYCYRHTVGGNLVAFNIQGYLIQDGGVWIINTAYPH